MKFPHLAVVLASAVMAFAQTPCSDARFASPANGIQVFDLNISLYRTPSLADRALYEEVIQHFARGVYEMSNGGHLLRNVHFYQNGANITHADIIWNESQGRSNANPGGVLWRSLKIRTGDFADVLDASTGTVTTVDFLHNGMSPTDRQRMGYTLAHEFGHYAYTLFDEYVEAGIAASTNLGQPLSTDNAVTPSIMNSQSNAIGGNWQWLNLSTAHNYQAATAQGRVWGMSGWELVRSPCATRPAAAFTSLANRVVYTALANRAPLATDVTNGSTWVRNDLSSPAISPLTYLNPIWHNSAVEMELVLDVSGSMGGQPIADVITAGQGLADQLFALGNSHLGITSFATTPNPLALPLQPLATQAQTDAAKAGIMTLIADGTTAMYDAAKDALTKLVAYDPTPGSVNTKFAFLLSDGDNNASTRASEASVIADYQARNIPLHTIGYGNGAFHGTLGNLATGTQGVFHNGITSSADLQNAFFAAYAQAANMQRTPVTFQNARSVTIPFGTPGAHQASFRLLATPATAIPDIEVIDANNVECATCTVTPVANTAGVYQWDVTVTIPAAEVAANGTTWSFAVNGINGAVTIPNSAVVPGAITFFSLPNLTERDFEMIVDVPSKTYAYPEPVTFMVSMQKEFAISGVTYSALLETPSHQLLPITLNDDGREGDFLAGDGVYGSSITNYTENGTYTVHITGTNENGQAQYVIDNMHRTAGVSSGDALVPVGQDFGRIQTFQFTVDGMQSDDAGNDILNARPLPINAAALTGRIDVAGDIDVFHVINVVPNREVAIRVFGMANGTRPEIVVLDASGNFVAQANILSAPSSRGYLLAMVPASAVTGNFYARVTDLDASFSGGTYQIEAGSTTRYDTPTLGALRVKTRDVNANTDNLLGLSVIPENTGDEPISDFRIRYYFSTENMKTPVLEQWYSQYATVRLVQTDDQQYAVEFDFTGTTIAPRSTLPINPDNVVGIHYPDWSPLNKAKHFSNLTTVTPTLNSKVSLLSSTGALLYGAIAPSIVPPSPVVDVKILSRQTKLGDAQWTAPEFHIKNDGSAISGLKASYYLSANPGKTPRLSVWSCPNATVSMTSLGGNNYQVVANYGSKVIPTDAPSHVTNCLFGVNHTDWSAWNKNDDASENGSASFVANPRMTLEDASGRILYGTK